MSFCWDVILVGWYVAFLFFLKNRLERKTVQRKKVLATLKVLGNVLEQLTKEVSPEEADRLIPDEVWSLITCTSYLSVQVLAFDVRAFFYMCKLLVVSSSFICWFLAMILFIERSSNLLSFVRELPSNRSHILQHAIAMNSLIITNQRKNHSIYGATSVMLARNVRWLDIGGASASLHFLFQLINDSHPNRLLDNITP